jgi:hypothetical protein
VVKLSIYCGCNIHSGMFPGPDGQEDECTYSTVFYVGEEEWENHDVMVRCPKCGSLLADSSHYVAEYM